MAHQLDYVCTLCYNNYDIKHPLRQPKKLTCEHTFCTGKYDLFGFAKFGSFFFILILSTFKRAINVEINSISEIKKRKNTNTLRFSMKNVSGIPIFRFLSYSFPLPFFATSTYNRDIGLGSSLKDRTPPRSKVKIVASVVGEEDNDD